MLGTQSDDPIQQSDVHQTPLQVANAICQCIIAILQNPGLCGALHDESKGSHDQDQYVAQEDKTTWRAIEAYQQNENASMQISKPAKTVIVV